MRLSIGPIQYFWPRERVLDFYRQITRSAVETVYLGEVICSKRRELKLADWIAVGDELEQAGKEVLLSSLTLLEAASETASLKRLCSNKHFMVEANNVDAIHLLSSAGKAFVSGPSVNIYNQRSLALLAARGLKRWVLPVELGLETLAGLQAQRPEGVETEVFALGRLPLAYSARCYTARSHNLPKDDCRFKCLDDPDGRILKTRGGEDFLVLNGIQTQSALTHQVLEQLPEFESLGVDVLRLSPQSEHMPRIIEIFAAALEGATLSPLSQELDGLLPLGACNGYVMQQPGMQQTGMDHGTSHVA